MGRDTTAAPTRSDLLLTSLFATFLEEDIPHEMRKIDSTKISADDGDSISGAPSLAHICSPYRRCLCLE